MTDETRPAGGAETQQLLTREEAAAVAQAQALQHLATAVSPLIQQILDSGRAAKRDEHEHEIRAAEHEAAVTERLHKRAYPLVWLGALTIAGVVGWACYVGRWEIATHVLTAIIAGASGYSLRAGKRDHDSE